MPFSELLLRMDGQTAEYMEFVEIQPGEWNMVDSIMVPDDSGSERCGLFWNYKRGRQWQFSGNDSRKERVLLQTISTFLLFFCSFGFMGFLCMNNF